MPLCEQSQHGIPLATEKYFQLSLKMSFASGEKLNDKKIQPICECRRIALISQHYPPTKIVRLLLVLAEYR